MRANLHGGWFELRADVQVDQGRVLELSKMLREVAASQSRFIQLDDHTFVALSETLHRRMQELAAIAELAGDQVKVATALAPLLQDDVLPQGDALELLARQRTLEKYSATVPTSLRATLRPYQLDGFQWLARMMRWGVGAVLADDMGLGKTIMTLALLLHRLRVKGQEGPVLIVVPTSLIANWQREAATFAPKLRMQTWRKIRDTPEVELGLRDVVVISYGMLARASEDVARRRWGAVVFDEAHALKNPQTQRAKAAATIDAGFRLALSGTPLENHLGELWSLFRILNPGMLGSAQRFTQRFITPIERDHDVRTLARLRRIVSPFMLRRRKEDVLKDLPERIEIIREVHLDRDERALYEAVRRKVLEDLSKSSSSHNPGERKLRVLAELMKIDRSKLSASDKIAYDVFKRDKEQSLKGYSDEIMALTRAS